MDGQQKRKLRLKDLDEQIKERREYLNTTERNITAATESAAYRIQELQGDINALDNEKARLLKQRLSLDQEIRERKLELTKLF